jgi:hypothetical protein
MAGSFADVPNDRPVYVLRVADPDRLDEVAADPVLRASIEDDLVRCAADPACDDVHRTLAAALWTLLRSFDENGETDADQLSD